MQHVRGDGGERQEIKRVESTEQRNMHVCAKRIRFLPHTSRTAANPGAFPSTESLPPVHPRRGSQGLDRQCTWLPRLVGRLIAWIPAFDAFFVASIEYFTLISIAFSQNKRRGTPQDQRSDTVSQLPPVGIHEVDSAKACRKRHTLDTRISLFLQSRVACAGTRCAIVSSLRALRKHARK